jgi:hypothetical protein
MLICTVGDPEDLTSAYVAWLAESQGHDVWRLHEQSVGVDWSFGFDDSDATGGYIRCDQEKHSVRRIAGVFVRFHPDPPLPAGLELRPEKAALFRLERRTALHHFLNSISCCVVNRPCAGRSNGSKPYQMRWLTSQGFHVPRWITTNDVLMVDEFLSTCHRGAIYKSCSGIRSHVHQLDEELRRRLNAGTSPVVVQEYIAGRDVRVHTIEGKAFATEVTSSASTIDSRRKITGSAPCRCLRACNSCVATRLPQKVCFSQGLTSELQTTTTGTVLN